MARSNTPATDEYLAGLVGLLDTYANNRGRQVGDKWVPMSDSLSVVTFSVGRTLHPGYDKGRVTMQKAGSSSRNVSRP